MENEKNIDKNKVEKIAEGYKNKSEDELIDELVKIGKNLKGKEEVVSKFKNFLESINYTGFSNFDIKYDTRDNTYKVFEINLRQGRSNYYVTGSGNNIAEYVVKDRVENKELELKEHIEDGIDYEDVEKDRALTEDDVLIHEDLENGYEEEEMVDNEDEEDSDELFDDDNLDDDDSIYDNDGFDNE